MSNVHTGSSRDVKEKEHTRRELLAKYLYDVSKLFIATMFIVNIVPLFRGDVSVPDVMATVLGFLSAILITWFANRLLIY